MAKKQMVSILVKTSGSGLMAAINKAEAAVKHLCEVVKEIEFMENGMAVNITAEDVNMAAEEGRSGSYLYVSKYIDVEAVKGPLEEVKKIMAPLKEQVEKLDAAIIEEIITKNAPDITWGK